MATPVSQTRQTMASDNANSAIGTPRGDQRKAESMADGSLMTQRDFDVSKWQSEEQWDRESKVRAMKHRGLEVMMRAMANLNAERVREQLLAPTGQVKFLLESFE